MNKATVISHKKMRENQVRKDISMTPLQRLDLAFQISDFAAAFDRERESGKESIQWIELRKVSNPHERNTR